MHKGFLKAGHLPTLFCAFLYFDISFMVWVILGPLGIQIAKTLALDPAHKGLMVATPVLAGALLRVVNGILVDHIGPKRTGLLAQAIVIAGLAFFWWYGIHNFMDILAVGLFLGMAGASFAVALPLASRWYPAQHQGTALGIAGAGNSGTVLASLFAPTLAVMFGWRNVIGLAVIPLLVVLVVYTIFAKDSPNRPAAKSFSAYFEVLKDTDAWWFMLLYSVTFGGFVGLASSLPIYYNTQYGLSPVIAGYCTAAAVFAGSLMRPVGGALSDRLGGINVLTIIYSIAACALAAVSFGLPQLWMAVLAFVTGMCALGTGNGAVFQLVPQRFGKEIGVMTGLVGMTGGVGGFYLASSLGYSKQLTGSYQSGFLLFAGLALVALIALKAVERQWRMSWGTAASAAE
ncbi:MAG: NarK/NasA family nitrate transporter [Alphaproteobacteria bacterium]|nr:NarK/NasA family nitrate transporter [Alphaproteobacteria bacterium]MDE2499123.1 NarK/NasA family nitrate transporter [Alphaproteobacteria bacterium]